MARVGENSGPVNQLNRSIPRAPDEKRNLTDVIFFILFITFIAIWIGIGIYALKVGDFEKILTPTDSYGRKCGQDVGVKDKPYLFFFDLTKCLKFPLFGCSTTQVCVNECPKESYYEGKTGKLDPRYCDEVTKECPKWYIASEPVLMRCLYGLRKVADNGRNDQQRSFLERQLDVGRKWVASLIQGVLTMFTEHERPFKIGQRFADDIYKILLFLLLAVVLCIVYLLVLRWIAAIMIWSSIVGVLIAFAVGIYFSGSSYVYYKDAADNEPHPDIKEDLNTRKTISLVLLIAAVIGLTIILLILIFLRNRIQLAIQLIREASKAASTVTSVFFFPLIIWILQIGILAFAVSIGMFLYTIGDQKYRVTSVNTPRMLGHELGSICDPNNFYSTHQGVICAPAKTERPVMYPYLQGYNVVAYFWATFFVSDFGLMVMATVFSKWYWTLDKRTLPFFQVTGATLIVLAHHLGTIALGSAIITICRLIRLGLEYLHNKAKKYEVQSLLCVCRCCFWCLEKILKFINRNAYIMCAIHGQNFCSSARKAVGLILRNIVRVFVLDKVTDYLFFITKLLISAIVGAGAYFVFRSGEDLDYAYLPMVVLIVCTYLIASIFLSVYSIAVDTLFLCFLEDCERNDGSAERPYFMSKNLRRILWK